MSAPQRGSQYVMVPLTEWTEQFGVRPFRFASAEVFDGNRWTRRGDNPNWSIGVVVDE